MVIMGRMGTTFLPRPLWNFTDVGDTIRSKPPTRALVEEIACGVRTLLIILQTHPHGLTTCKVSPEL